MAGEIVYAICGLTSALCAYFLFRQYKRTGTRLLLWSCLCFVGLALNSCILFADMVVFSDIDLSLIRILPAVAGAGLLIYGFIWDLE